MLAYISWSLTLPVWVFGSLCVAILLSFGLGYTGFPARVSIPITVAVSVCWPASIPLMVVVLVLFGLHLLGQVVFVYVDKRAKG